MVTDSPGFLLETVPVSVTFVPDVTIGAEASSVSVGGRPLTTSLPVSFGCSSSLYVYVPEARNVNENVWFGLMIGETNWPLSASTWWFELSRFFQVTVSPSVIVVDLGEKPEP